MVLTYSSNMSPRKIMPATVISASIPLEHRRFHFSSIRIDVTISVEHRQVKMI